MEIKGRKEAIRDGENTYFTGNRCSNGHLSYRYVKSGTCYECIHASRSAGSSDESLKMHLDVQIKIKEIRGEYSLKIQALQIERDIKIQKLQSECKTKLSKVQSWQKDFKNSTKIIEVPIYGGQLEEKMFILKSINALRWPEVTWYDMLASHKVREGCLHKVRVHPDDEALVISLIDTKNPGFNLTTSKSKYSFKVLVDTFNTDKETMLYWMEHPDFPKPIDGKWDYDEVRKHLNHRK